MKFLKKAMLLGLGLLMSVSASAQLGNNPTREHRAVWLTPFLSNGWPSTAINASNATTIKNQLESQMRKFNKYNINVIYYHCRSMCDATYKSSYEPWSSTVSGKRGVAPAFDPFEYLVECAHKYGIEVYAWINPYRYCSSTKYGEGELNYENSHPEWLISQAKETILNPGLEEVKQRIVDVISEIVTNYDVDGVVFDDYFYTSSTPMNLDADLYSKYTSGGGKLSQADWRRANVNEMVSRVNTAIKKIKPYVVFGISPAGVASPPTVSSEYGLEPAPGGGDWQYNGIYSDPLAWLKAGTIDFISPQIYWPNRFSALSEWWATAVQKYNRHCYPSGDISTVSTDIPEEFSAEIERTREVSLPGTSGFVFFHYGTMINIFRRIDGTLYDLSGILSFGVHNTKVLQPLHPWIKSTAPDMVTNVKSDGTTLSWDANAAGRYAIYKVPANQTQLSLDLHDISYTNSYELPEDASDYTWYVAAYDRYANVTPALGVGAVKQTGSAPKLTYPANGEKPVDLFEFKWDHESNLDLYTVEVAEDAAFNKIIGTIDVQGKKVSVTHLPTLTDGKTYYWRVSATDVNREHPMSAVSSFVAPRISITSPTAAQTVGIHPTLTWSKAVDGADYKIEVSSNSAFSTTLVNEVVKTNSYTVPSFVLSTGTKYYARVTASIDEVSSMSETITFNTENKSDYPAPTIVNPTQSGATMHSNETVTLAPCEGMAGMTVNIATTESFPVRTSYTTKLSNSDLSTNALSEIKISSKNLEDGATYYLRAVGSYNLDGSALNKSTDYTPTYTFVYSSEAGVTDLVVDEDATWFENATTMHIGKGVEVVTVYNLAGVTVAAFNVKAGDVLDLSALANGTYIVKAGATTFKMIR